RQPRPRRCRALGAADRRGRRGPPHARPVQPRPRRRPRRSRPRARAARGATRVAGATRADHAGRDRSALPVSAATEHATVPAAHEQAPSAAGGGPADTGARDRTDAVVRPRFARVVAALLRKELRVELRTLESAPGMALFSVTVFVLFHF